MILKALLIIYLVIMALIGIWLYINWDWFKQTYETIKYVKGKQAEAILNEKDKKKRKELLKKSLFRVF